MIIAFGQRWRFCFSSICINYWLAAGHKINHSNWISGFFCLLEIFFCFYNNSINWRLPWSSSAMFGLFIFLFCDWKFRVKIVNLFGLKCNRNALQFDLILFWLWAFSASFEPISMNRIFTSRHACAIDINADFTAWPPGSEISKKKENKLEQWPAQPSPERTHYKNKCKRPLTAFFELFLGFKRECCFCSKKNLLLASRYKCPVNVSNTFTQGSNCLAIQWNRLKLWTIERCTGKLAYKCISITLKPHYV